MNQRKPTDRHVHVARAIAAVLVFLSIGISAGPVAAASAEQLLEEAVLEYRAALDAADRDARLERFRRAELLFSRLVGGPDDDPRDPTDGIRNADLYTNLGNAALQAERLGPAVLAFRRALALDPDHRRASQNLEHARRLLPEWVPRPQTGGILDTFFVWSRALARGERSALAALLFVLTAILVAVAIRWRRTLFRNLALIPAAGWLVLVGSLLIDPGRAGRDEAVVMVPETIARAADSARAPARFNHPLPGGAEVRIIETRDRWSHIRLANGRDAWVQSSSLAPVLDS